MNYTCVFDKPSEIPIGIIAGEGELPWLEAQGILAAGHPLIGVAISRSVHPKLKKYCQSWHISSPLRPLSWRNSLRKHNCKHAVMVGSIRKEIMYQPLNIIRNLPDFLALKLWFHTLKNDRRSQNTLGTLANTLHDKGLTLIDTTKYIPEHMASVGVMTQKKPSNNHLRDIEMAQPILATLNQYDIGQGLCIGGGDIIALEGMEGTDRMIARAGELTGKGGKGWTLIKGATRLKDPRFDVPTVGINTIETLAKHGATCLAVVAAHTILINKPEVIAMADKLGIAIVGIAAENL